MDDSTLTRHQQGVNATFNTTPVRLKALPKPLTKLYKPRAFKRKLTVCRPNKQVPRNSIFAVANEGTVYSECRLVPSPQLFVIKSDKRLEKVITNTYSSIRP